jgi:hypothetical protein
MMKFEKYCVALVFLAGVACRPGVKDRGQSPDSGLNAPSPSEQIASQAIEAREKSITRTVESGDKRFTVVTNGDENLRSLKVAVVNLKGDTTKADSTEIRDVKGFLTNVAVADLDKDGNQEVYCFTQSKGTEMAGSVYGIAYLNGKAITIQPGNIDQVSVEGYKGRDSFYVQAPYLMRTYPLYKQGDPDAVPSGGKKTVKYKLEKFNLVEAR